MPNDRNPRADGFSLTPAEYGDVIEAAKRRRNVGARVFAELALIEMSIGGRLSYDSPIVADYLESRATVRELIAARDELVTA